MKAPAARWRVQLRDRDDVLLPWKDEPDQITWIDEITGYRCLMIRHPEHCAWCGYVGVPEDHTMYGMDYNDRVEMKREDVELPDRPDILTIFAEAIRDNPDGTVPVGIALKAHGNVNYADRHEGYPDWFFGFACSTPGDMQLMSYWNLYRAHGLSMLVDLVCENAVYRDVDYVTNECRHLAEQLLRRA